MGDYLRYKPAIGTTLSELGRVDKVDSQII
jgi:hypothetical protein